MPVRINNNIAAINAHRNLLRNDSQLSLSLERLSSGFRINKASDDASGLVISENLRAQITGMTQAIANSQDAVSVIQTAEGALNEVHTLLNSMRSLGLHAMNTGVTTATQIAADQSQIDSAVDSIDRIAATTKFAGRRLLDGSAGFQTSNVATEITSIDAAAGTTTPQSITVEVTLAATQAKLDSQSLTGGAVSGGTVTITGNKGSSSITIISGTSTANVAAAINAETSNTGVTATVSGLFIHMDSENFGSSGFVGVVDAGTILTAATSGGAVGSDITGKIAGTDATGVGNTLTLTAADGGSFVGSVTMDGATATDATDYTFDIAGGSLVFQLGADAEPDERTEITIDDIRTDKLGNATIGFISDIKTGGTSDLTSNAANSVKIIDEAISDISTVRQKLGAFQKNTLESNIANLSISKENITASESRIRDLDVAFETVNFTKAQILLQASTAMLAQANVAPQTVLQLLQ
jgi:flagellin